MRIRALLLAAGLVLAACHGSDGGSPFGAGHGVAPPARRPGLWAQTIQADGAPVSAPLSICYDAKTDRRMSIFGRQFRRGACEKYSIGRAPDGRFVSDAVCQMGAGAKVTSHTVVSGDFASRYVVTSQRLVQGAADPAMNGRHATLITAVYKGPCPPGMSPGQVRAGG